jgi:hypothetical protein
VRKKKVAHEDKTGKQTISDAFKEKEFREKNNSHGTFMRIKATKTT